jgi:hypothetical protein
MMTETDPFKEPVLIIEPSFISTSKSGRPSPTISLHPDGSSLIQPESNRQKNTIKSCFISAKINISQKNPPPTKLREDSYYENKQYPH